MGKQRPASPFQFRQIQERGWDWLQALGAFGDRPRAFPLMSDRRFGVLSVVANAFKVLTTSVLMDPRVFLRISPILGVNNVQWLSWLYETINNIISLCPFPSPKQWSA